MTKMLLLALWLPVGLATTLIVAFAVGARLGRVRADEEPHVGVLQGATLGILGLLMGFCFSGAMSRFVDRQDIVVREGNAIGTSWLRADLLPPAARDRVRALLRTYTATRIELHYAVTRADETAVLARLKSLQSDLWAAAMRGVDERPGAALLVLPPLNDVFDLLSTRQAAAQRHIPPFVLALMAAGVVVGAGVLGYGQHGRSRAVRVASVVVVMLIAAMIWATIDLDFPQRGLIQISVQPLRDALADMGAG